MMPSAARNTLGRTALPSRSGFSLVELSVVLIILGLLVGGIVAGMAIKRNADVRSAASDAQGYAQAAALFQQKYMEIPGDFSGAQALWGAATCPSSYNETARPKTTCNGNGDGMISNTAASEERWRAWQHLFNAEMVDQNLAGSAAPGTTSKIGYNTAATKLGNAGFTWSSGALVGNFYQPAQMILTLGAANATWTNGPALTGARAEQLDRKFDDGKPLTGRVQIALSASTALGSTPSSAAINQDCAKTSNAAGVLVEGSYSLGEAVDACALQFATGVR